VFTSARPFSGQLSQRCAVGRIQGRGRLKGHVRGHSLRDSTLARSARRGLKARRYHGKWMGMSMTEDVSVVVVVVALELMVGGSVWRFWWSCECCWCRSGAIYSSDPTRPLPAGSEPVQTPHTHTHTHTHTHKRACTHRDPAKSLCFLEQ